MKNTVIIAGDFLKKVMPYIKNSKKSIDIIVFDWRWYANEPSKECQQFNQAIVQSARRGVQIRAVVNSDAVAAPLRSAGVSVKKHLSAHLLHAKIMIIDDQIIITGSHNYTQSAMSANYELSVILEDVENINDFKTFFQNIWSS